MWVFLSLRAWPTSSTGSPLKLIHYLHCTAVQKFPRKLPNNNKESRGKWSPCCYGGHSRGAPKRRTRGALQWEKIWDTWNQLKAPRLASSSYAFLFPPPLPLLFTFSPFSSLFLHLAMCTGKLPSTCYLWIQKIWVQGSWRGVCKCRTIPKLDLS